MNKFFRYTIDSKKRDVIDFMINREINPSRYIVPTSWYKYGNEDVKPYRIRIQPPLPNDPQKTRRYYESKLADYPDVIDVSAIVEFTGYNRHTVCEWIRFGKLRALALQHKYMIPKCYLIDLSGDSKRSRNTPPSVQWNPLCIRFRDILRLPQRLPL